MIPQSWSVPELLRWAQWGHLDKRFRDLLRPNEVDWSDDPEGFEEAFVRLQRILPHSRQHLLPQAVIAAALANPAAAPAGITDWLPTAVDLQDLGITISWETLIGMRWGLFPIALADDERAVITYVLAGTGGGESGSSNAPLWWSTVADREACKSLATVSNLLGTQRQGAFFFWPVLPFCDRLLIHGTSLGLPFYLAIRGLRKGHVARGLLATGRIEEDGSVGAVGGLALNAMAAVREGLTALLHPKASAPPGVGAACNAIERFEVETVQEADFLWETYQPGEGSGLLEDRRVLAHPERLAANVLLLSEAILRWPGFGAEYAMQIEVLAERELLLGQLLDNLERAADQPDCAADRMRIMLAPFTEQKTDTLASQNPLASFRIAQLQLGLCNRQGQVEGAEQWAELGDSLLKRVTAIAQGLEMRADHLNRRFVHHYHGRYDFRPDLPGEVKEVLKHLEELWRVTRCHQAGAALPSLGKLYGTIAQNYGFCGPAYLDEVERYTLLAEAAFGGGGLPIYEDSRRRQACYRFYARLDAYQPEQAWEALDEYLGLPFEQCTDMHFSRLNPYHHAAMARFCAEQDEAPGTYLRWSTGKAYERLTGHPWQLWLNNVGRAMQEPVFRAMVWSRSVELALSLGASARPMALLPLANLWQNGLWEWDLLEKTTRDVLSTMEDSVLCRDHFGTLLVGGSWQDILATVHTSGCRLFPFTYR